MSEIRTSTCTHCKVEIYLDPPDEHGWQSWRHRNQNHSYFCEFKATPPEEDEEERDLPLAESCGIR